MNTGLPQRILIIDDNPAIHEDFRKILVGSQGRHLDLAEAEAAVFGETQPLNDHLHVELDFALQGQEGFEKVVAAQSGNRPFALAFVDMRMPPGWNGLETIEKLWSVDPAIQVVICTAYSDHNWNEICDRLGHRDNLIILKKPFDCVEVCQLTVAFLEKWRLQRDVEAAQVTTDRLIKERTAQLQTAQTQLRTKNQQLQLAANMASLGYWSIDVATGKLTWSHNMFSILGVPSESETPTWEDMIGLFADDEQAIASEAIRRALEFGHASEFRGSVRGQEVHTYLHTKIHCELDEARRPKLVFGVTQDVSEHEQALQTIQHTALHDPLTGLPNRAKFHESLSGALRETQSCGRETALILLDLDNFKEVNDGLGHPVGDQLLQQLSRRLESEVGKAGLVARLGGDEFAIIVSSGKAAQDVACLMDRLHAAVRDRFKIEDEFVYTTLSAGIAIAPLDGDEIDALLKNADLALYKAKHDGRGCHRFFEGRVDDKIRHRRAFETDLRSGIARDEFEIFYQPIVESESTTLSCFEALLRWRHPELGLIPPLDFIPIAEQSGLIVPIGKWVLHQACRDAATWPDHINVAVNVSAVQFMHDSLVETVVSAISQAGLNADRLELEITESIFLEDTERTLDTLHEIRELGVRVVMDDFGVGYSSLSYLRSFPFDKLKLDRTFVKDANVNVESKAILKAVAGLGATLGMQTTAEGVEDSELLRQICDEGYSYVQGYLLGKPQPLHGIEQLLNEGHAPSLDCAVAEE